jgi:2-amino-4-hydroxy-6-hydroxymethyldihydropteridine diphosphokinase
VTEVYLGLGSNVGDRESHLSHALRRLMAESELRAASSVYETDPVGLSDQPPFLNMVVRISTALAPQEVLRLAREIEAERGRVRTFRNAPRTLDIDILLYGREILRREGLIVPHPRMAERAFVLIPVLELDPDITEPGTGRAYHDMLDSTGAAAGVREVMTAERLLAGDRA